MGRHAGWIATHAGMAGGAAEILVPEVPFDLDAGVRAPGAGATSGAGTRPSWSSRRARCRPRARRPGGPARPPPRASTDQFGHARLGGIGAWLAEEIERRTGYESRVTTLGHIQRGGTPTAYDRVLATRFGVAAVAAVHDGDFGTMVALQAGSIVRVPLAEAVGASKALDLSLLDDVAAPFLG